MCEFISWIEHKGNVYYLNYKDIFHTRRGKELRDYCKNRNDYTGHGAIRYYYDNFEGGAALECSDFTTPENFPDEIVAAIKKGEFRGLGVATQLLTDESQKVYDAAMVESRKVYDAAMVESRKVYYAVMVEPQKVYDAANLIFWDLFKNLRNRNPLWR